MPCVTAPGVADNKTAGGAAAEPDIWSRSVKQIFCYRQIDMRVCAVILEQRPRLSVGRYRKPELFRGTLRLGSKRQLLGLPDVHVCDVRQWRCATFSLRRLFSASAIATKMP
jgi:hypothetical protein